MKKRILALLLSLLLLLSAYAAPEGETVTALGTEPAEAVTAPAETLPPEAPLYSFRINGVDISRYTVVIPADGDHFTCAAALNIVDYFAVCLGIELELITDAEPERPYEILLGATNRPQSARTCALGEGQYALFCTEGKLVLQGDSYLIGGGFGMLLRDYMDPTPPGGVIDVTDLPTAPSAADYVWAETCDSVILMIGDGMGYQQINMALDNGLDQFVAQALPHVGAAVTCSQSVLDGDARFTDSAAASTALATGYKTKNGRLGLGPDGAILLNVRELAHIMGARTAVLTTDKITGATPSGFLVHVPDRDDTEAIQTRLDALLAAGGGDYCAGSVGDELLDRTRAALKTISGGPFFMMIEEGQIDKRCHKADAAGTCEMVARFNEAVAYAVEFALCHPGTALIVTADHETGGLTPATAKEDVADLIREDCLEAHGALIAADIARFGYAYTTYSSADTVNCTHSNVDVPLFAIGPGTERFHGVATDNTDIARFIAAVYGATNFGQAQ